jgi:hypothetical protein
MVFCQSGVSMRRSLRRTLAIHSAFKQRSNLNVVPARGIISLIFFIIYNLCLC